MSVEETRDKCIDYLVKSNFIEAYVKKLMFSSDIDALYDDFKQEVYLSILEVPAEKIATLYNNSIAAKDPDEFYQLRNFISRLVYNTVHSTSSTAYKKLKKWKTIEYTQTPETWCIYENTIDDDYNLINKVKEQNYEN